MNAHRPVDHAATMLCGERAQQNFITGQASPQSGRAECAVSLAFSRRHRIERNNGLFNILTAALGTNGLLFVILWQGEHVLKRRVTIFANEVVHGHESTSSKKLFDKD